MDEAVDILTRIRSLPVTTPGLLATAAEVVVAVAQRVTGGFGEPYEAVVGDSGELRLWYYRPGRHAELSLYPNGEITLLLDSSEDDLYTILELTRERLLAEVAEALAAHLGSPTQDLGETDG